MRISTGSSIFDSFLEGGYETEVITSICGPGGSGKTTICMLEAIEIASRNKKVLYIDTEGSFSLERLKQLTQDHEEILEKIIFLRPTSFKEQKNTFLKLRKLVDNKIGIIIVDTISMFYRLELGKDSPQETNRELGRQLCYLTEIARKKKLPILIANQVYADFKNKNRVNIVGGDLLKYSSKCIIELQNLKAGNRRAVLRKHRSIKEEKHILFKIVEKGIEPFKEKRGFRFF